jgi:hypothetical protein
LPVKPVAPDGKGIQNIPNDIFIDTDCYPVAIKDEYPVRSDLERINPRSQI